MCSRARNMCIHVQQGTFDLWVMAGSCLPASQPAHACQDRSCCHCCWQGALQHQRVHGLPVCGPSDARRLHTMT
jgi:hypothetical protein